MDWKSVVSLVLERAEWPAVVLDGRRRVEMINQAMERATGRVSADVVGRSFAEAFGAPEHRREIDERLRRTLRNRGETLELDLLCVGGKRTHTRLAVRPVESGRGCSGALLESQAPGPANPFAPMPEIDVYEIEVRSGHFGQTLYRWAGGKRHPGEGKRCCSLRYGLDEPCRQCPARNVDRHHRRATAVISVPGGDQYDIATAEYVDGRTVRVSACRVHDPILSSLVQARVTRLSEQAGLSERERTVLTYLLMGRTQQDIGKILGITPRTVKFHQRNVLQKLGADSRVDLMRFFI